MNLRERVTHLERWFDNQRTIDDLRTNLYGVRRDLDSLANHLGLAFHSGTHIKKIKGENQ